MPRKFSTHRLFLLEVCGTLIILAIMSFSSTSSSTTSYMSVHALPFWSDARQNTERAVSKGSREQQITFWEREINNLHAREMDRAYSKLYTAQTALDAARRKEGFFYTRPEDKAAIRLLDEEYRKSLVEVNILKEQEKLMLAKLKPLYGLVSTQFAQEQKETIASAIKTVQEISYNNAWYSSLFNIGEAESFTDLIIGFVVQWVIGYVLMYPFAILYYAVWKAPWSIYAYTSSMSDLIPAAVAYVICILVMSGPFLALVAGIYFVARKYGTNIDLLNNAGRRRRHSRYHFD